MLKLGKRKEKSFFLNIWKMWFLLIFESPLRKVRFMTLDLLKSFDKEYQRLLAGIFYSEKLEFYKS